MLSESETSSSPASSICLSQKILHCVQNDKKDKLVSGYHSRQCINKLRRAIQTLHQLHMLTA
jgi:hypothetical protein